MNAMYDDFVCLYCGLTSQSTIFQSCWDGATTSWVLPRELMCLAERHNVTSGDRTQDLSL